MSENKFGYRDNVSSLTSPKMDLGEIPSQNPKRDCRLQAGLEIIQPGIEMETIVSKLITHLKKNYK